jgi:hypothetical protein
MLQYVMCPGWAEDICLGDYLVLNPECLLCELIAFVTCEGSHFVQAFMIVVQWGMEAIPMFELYPGICLTLMENLSQVSQRVLGTILLYTKPNAYLPYFSELCSPSIVSVCAVL